MAQNNQDEYQEFQTDYARIKRDVKKVVITNVVILILLVGLYFANQKFDFLTSLNKFF